MDMMPMADFEQGNGDIPGEKNDLYGTQEMPRTWWPTVAGFALIFSMVLLLLTAWLSYYSAEYVDQMSGKGTVEGIVREEIHEKHEPLKDVNVSILETDIWTLTDSSGYYELPDVPAGIHKIQFAKPGYKIITLKAIIYSSSDVDADSIMANNFSFPANIRFGIATHPFFPKIERQYLTLTNGTVSGRVANETGQVLPGMNMSYIHSDVSGPIATDVFKSLELGAGGEFSLNITPGRYILNFSYPGYNTIHQYILVDPGNDSHFEIQMEQGNGFIENKLDSTVTIQGAIKNPEGEPIEGVLVKIGTNISALTDFEGKYILENVPLGLRTLSVSKLGYSAIFDELFIINNTSNDFELENLGESVIDNTDVTTYYYCALTYVIIAVLVVVGGILSLRRKSYGHYRSCGYIHIPP
jgi:hypothetical protein